MNNEICYTGKYTQVYIKYKHMNSSRYNFMETAVVGALLRSEMSLTLNVALLEGRRLSNHLIANPEWNTAGRWVGTLISCLLIFTSHEGIHPAAGSGNSPRAQPSNEGDLLLTWVYIIWLVKLTCQNKMTYGCRFICDQRSRYCVDTLRNNVKDQRNSETYAVSFW